MKKIQYFVLGFGILCLGFVLAVGCGGGSSGGGSTPIPTATITLSGNLAGGTISSAGINAAAALSSYRVVAIANATGKTYNALTDSSGNFSIDIPSEVSYEVSLVDTNSEYLGPIVMVGNSSSSEVIVGIIPDSDADLGAIVVDTTNMYALPTVAAVSIANSDDKAQATGGKPKGAGNDGKTEFSGITNRSFGADRDKDGIPNIFDADEDNDGKRNGVASTPVGATVSSAVVQSVFMSSNIWADHGTSDAAKDLIDLRLNVVPVSGQIDAIASIEVISVPSTIKDVATVRWASSLGSPEGYPAENSLWKASGYQLYKTTALDTNQWIVSICPKAIMNVGDTFTVRVYLTAGGYEDYFLTTSYVLTSWSTIETYNTTSMPTAQGTNSNPITFSNSSLAITFTKPLDEDGNILEGLSYSVRYATSEYDSGAGGYLVPSEVTETPVSDTGGSTLSYTISTVTAETYYVCPVAESADGQRNGEEVWFTKQ